MKNTPLLPTEKHLAFHRNSKGVLWQTIHDKQGPENVYARRICAIKGLHPIPQHEREFFGELFNDLFLEESQGLRFQQHIEPISLSFQPKVRQLRMIRTSRNRQCDENWCKHWGSRKKLGISSWTFTSKCARSCREITCQKCGKDVKAQPGSGGLLTHNTLSTGVCSQCRWNKERNAVAETLASQKKGSANSELQDRIVKIVERRFGKAQANRMTRAWNLRYGFLDEIEPTQVVTNTNLHPII